MKFFAQDGVLIGTIISLALINIPFDTMVVFREFFKEKALGVLKDYLWNAIEAIVIIYICYQINKCIKVNVSLISFIIKGIVTVCLTMGLFVLVHIKDSRLKDLMNMICGLIKSKTKFRN